MLVVFTTAVGYVMAAVGPIDFAALAATVIGTTLAALSANGLNQVYEIERDRLMNRTCNRPLPSGRIGSAHAITVTVLAGAVGVGLLYTTVNALSAMLALGTILIYLFVYTPLKTRSTLNTLVGAVVGAIPPMIGWAAAAGKLEAGAWVLGAVLFVWQIPHFLALAWMYREDYQRGGYRMLPSVDASGTLTCAAVMLYCLALLPVGLAATLAGAAGWLYAISSLALGLWLVSAGLRLAGRRDHASARKLFLASVMYLPLLLGVMLADRTPSQPAPSVLISERPAVAAPVAPRTNAISNPT
jgi:protoheme IX farnesyltransferase